MKVIAKSNESTYICEVSHDELGKFMLQYYGSMSKLVVGQDVDLGQGYNFAFRIEKACKQMAESMTAFEAVQKVMTSYAVYIANNSAQAAPMKIEK